ncbi:MAG: hypothetical protein IT428_25260 [Planctomycetaceae bacterium]|nr:hypothetical protein [Planctomycetaceae bacterium]
MPNNRPNLTKLATVAGATLCALALSSAAMFGPVAGLLAQETEKPEAATAEPGSVDKKGDEKPAKEKPAKDSAGEEKPASSITDKTTVTESKGAIEARATLKAAREKLLQFRSIKAKIIENVAISERRFKAEGVYLQGSNLRLRLELTVKAGSLTGTILEVCDGQVLYTQYSLGDTPRITRRDVKQILEATKAATKSPESQLVAELGLGGLPSLLASVEQAMKFSKAREETIDGQTFTVLEGTWGKEFMDQWKSLNKNSERLPEHIPDSVRIYLDSKTLLPRRFVYLKQPTEKGTPRPMVTLDFVDLVLNAPLSDDEFYYVPPDGVSQDDITHIYLDRLRPKGQPGQASEKPAEGK